MLRKSKTPFLIRLTVALFVVLSASTLAAKTTLKVAGHWGVPSQQYDMFMEAATAYMAENPDVVIEYTNENTGKDTGLQKLKVLLAGSMMPDLVEINTEGAADLQWIGALAAAPPQLESKIRSFFIPQVISGFTINGKIYGVPTENQVQGYAFNARMYNEVGLAPNPPKTWAEWKTHLQRLTIVNPDGTVQRYGTGTTEIHSLFLSMLWSNNGKFMEDGQIGMRSSAAIDTVQFFRELAQAGLCLPGGKPATVATSIAPSFVIRNLRGSYPDDYAAGNIRGGKIPAGAGTSTHLIYGWGVYVGNTPNQLEAWKFLEWWAMRPKPDTRVTWAGEQMLTLGLPTNQSDLMAKPELLSDPWYGAYIANLNSSKREIMDTPGYAYVNQIIANHFNAAVRGDVAPAIAMENAENEIAAKLAEYKK